jgi:hypothetical protein
MYFLNFGTTGEHRPYNIWGCVDKHFNHIDTSQTISADDNTYSAFAVLL